MRECGLKHIIISEKEGNVLVTPHAGVWIETSTRCFFHFKSWSLPMRECGLKPDHPQSDFFNSKSLPMRECGLKPAVTVTDSATTPVTPHAGVWIETFSTAAATFTGWGHSPCGSVD